MPFYPANYTFTSYSDTFPVRMLSGPSCLRHCRQPPDIFPLHLERIQVKIFFHSFYRRRFRQRDNASLYGKFQTDLCRRHSIFPSQLQHQRFFQHPLTADRAPCLYKYVSFLTVLYSCLLAVAGMIFNLIDRRSDRTVFKNIVNVMRQKITQADSPDLSCLI